MVQLTDENPNTRGSPTQGLDKMIKKSRPVSGARPSASSRQTVAATLQLVMEMENIVDRKRIAIFHKSNTHPVKKKQFSIFKESNNFKFDHIIQKITNICDTK